MQVYLALHEEGNCREAGAEVAANTSSKGERIRVAGKIAQLQGRQGVYPGTAAHAWDLPCRISLKAG